MAAKSDMGKFNVVCTVVTNCSAVIQTEPGLQVAAT